MPPLSLTTAFLLRGFIIGGVLDFANSVDLLMDHGFCDPCFRFFNDLHEEGAPQRLMELRLFNSQCYVWIHSVYSVNPMKLQESCFISRDQQWPDAYDAGMESKTAMIWPPSSSPAFQASFRLLQGGTDFSKVGKESRNQHDGRRLCKAGHFHWFPIGLYPG